MSDVLTATAFRPLQVADINRYIERASALDSEVTAEEVRALLSVKVACRIVTRKEAHLRGDLREATFEWLEKETGLKRSKIDLAEIDAELAQEAMSRLHACDILACLVWDECEGFEFGLAVPEWMGDQEFWQATPDPADWPYAKDWLFSRALGLAWEANPHWGLAEGHIPFG